jgi:chemotaxis protein histidine kinase CheA
MKRGPQEMISLPLMLRRKRTAQHHHRNNLEHNSDNDNGVNNYNDENGEEHVDNELEAVEEDEEEQPQEEEEEEEEEKEEEEEEEEEEEDEEEEEEEEDKFNSNNNNNHTFSQKNQTDLMDNFIKKAESIAQEKNIYNHKDDELFEKNSESTCTVSEFVRKFNNVSACHGFSKVAMLDILTLFDQCTCNLILPLKNRRRKKVFTNSDHFHYEAVADNKDYEEEEENIVDDDVVRNYKEEAAAQRNLDIDKYISEDSSKFEFHVCPKGCVIYIGNYAEMINCPICHSMRFSKCKHKSCQKKEYEECNPFADEEGHSIKYRFPIKTIYYRSSIILLTEKLLTARKKKLNYLDYLERKYEGFNYLNASDNNHIIDTVDSEPVKEHYNSMKTRFDDLLQPICIKLMSDKQIKKKVEMKNFILSGFFDGDTFFERKSDSGWMYLVGIHNCNPSDRMSLGKGLYLALLHLEKSGGNIERFFMKNVMAVELKKLEYGVFIQ